MSPAEKIVGAEPLIISGACILVMVMIAVLTEIIFPLGSPLWWFGFPAAALLATTAMITWVRALHVVATSRLEETESQKRTARGAFINAAVWSLVFSAATAAMPALPSQAFLTIVIVQLIAGFFWLRAIWITTKALLEFERSNDTFWTFVKIFYFPIGVWFLQARFHRLLSATPKSEPSFIR